MLKPQKKKPRPRLIQEAREGFSEFAYKNGGEIGVKISMYVISYQQQHSTLARARAQGRTERASVKCYFILFIIEERASVFVFGCYIFQQHGN